MKTISLVNLYTVDQSEVIECANFCIKRRKENAVKYPEFGTYAKNETASAKRFRKDPSYSNALRIVFETLKAEIYIDCRNTTIKY